jgi:pyruvate dehydrogenase E1 component alpha subunit
MSDPGTTYRSRDEVQAVRSERDAIAGLKKYILEWGATDEASLKAIDKAAKEEVDAAVAEAKESPQPDLAEFWKDIYVGLSPLDQRHELMKSVQGYRTPFHAWT